MPTPPRPAALLALATGLALTLAACGGDAASTAAAGSTATASTVPTTTSAVPTTTGAAPTTTSDISPEHGEADLAFVTGMHPHHQGAVEMAELAADRAGSEQVRALAARIAQAQAPEMARLEAMAKAWGSPLEAGGHGGAHGGGDGGDDAGALEGLSGAAFDRAFLTRMTAHHESALPMARAELADGTNPQARALAQEVLDVQQAEIAEMRELLADG